MKKSLDTTIEKDGKNVINCGETPREIVVYRQLRPSMFAFNDIR